MPVQGFGNGLQSADHQKAFGSWIIPSGACQGQLSPAPSLWRSSGAPEPQAVEKGAGINQCGQDAAAVPTRYPQDHSRNDQQRKFLGDRSEPGDAHALALMHMEVDPGICSKCVVLKAHS